MSKESQSPKIRCTVCREEILQDNPKKCPYCGARASGIRSSTDKTVS